MAFAGHHSDHDLGSNEDAYEYNNKKRDVEYVSEVALDHSTTARRRREAPLLVKDLSSEDRKRLELALVRKIDLRLLPMVILMYILNYLDRNNIASARLAGLEEELKLTSVQYQVCSRMAWRCSYLSVANPRLDLR